MRRIELVIFDCDGVLVDSELIANRVFVALLQELGLSLDLPYLFENFVGRSMQHCWVEVGRMLGREVPPQVQEELALRTRRALAAEVRPVAGIEAVLDDLDASAVPYCVASSGTHEKMATTLGTTGLLPRFGDRIFSATEVAHGKPAPDIFLYAAQRCGMPAGACAVIEDSPAGVQAGVAAGMTVFGYAGFTPAQRLKQAGARHTFDSMATLPGLLFPG